MSDTNRNAHGLSNLEKALDRWEGEGAAATSSTGSPALAFQAPDERLLRCLGAAVVLRWKDLPTVIQRDIFDSAASAEDPALRRELTQQLGRFLHRRMRD